MKQSQIVPLRMFTFFPLFPVASASGREAVRGWIFLGEIDKIVAVSPERFSESVKVSAACLTVRFYPYLRMRL